MSLRNWCEGNRAVRSPRTESFMSISSQPEKADIRRLTGGLIPRGYNPLTEGAGSSQPQIITLDGQDVSSGNALVLSRMATGNNQPFLDSGGFPDSNNALVANKTLKSLPRGFVPSRGPRARFFDPLSLVYATGFRDRRFSLTYDTLRRVSYQLSLVGAIIHTRINQIAAFAQPFRENRQVGFQIRPKDEHHLPDDDEKKYIQKLETYVAKCGWGRNFYAIKPRDDFETFLKKIVRDTMTYDQVCAVAGTWIELADGIGVPIEAIEAGMEVRTHTGEVKAVIQPTRRIYSGKMCRVRVRGQVLEVTAGHPVLVSQKISFAGHKVEVSEPQWIAAEHLTSDMYVVYPRPQLKSEICYLDLFKEEPRKFATGNLVNFAKECEVHPDTARQILTGLYPKNGPKKDLVLEKSKELNFRYEYKRRWEEKTCVDDDWGRFFGLYVAEGCVQKNTIRLTFHDSERELVSFVCSFAEEYGISASVIEYEERQGVTVLLSSQALASFLVTACGTGSANKRVPQCVLDSPKNVKSAFLYGYLMGDGCLQLNKCSFTTVSRDLFTGIRLLLADRGIYVAESVVSYDHYGWNTQYHGNISGEEYRKFAKEMGFSIDENIRTNRTFLMDEKFFYIKIGAVEYYNVENLPVFNMEIEDNHSYIAQGFVSHNCVELVPDQDGRPYEFHAVDAATMRLAATYDGYRGDKPRRFKAEDFTDRWSKDIKGEEIALEEDDVYSVQVLHGRIENIFTYFDMLFAIRNPRTDIWTNGYGFAEVEMALNSVLRTLWAEEYNSRIFRQGSMASGILNFKGDNFDPNQMESFRRIWSAYVAGVENSHRLPVLQIPEGVEFVNLQRGNREMEYRAWLEYLIKIVSGVFQIDPSEINFDLVSGAAGGSSPLFESKHEWKIKYSKDKGLRPLLRFIAKQISLFVIDSLDDRYYFDFLGLDQLTEQDRIDLLSKKITTYMTLNEGRKEEGLSPVKGGDIVLNPTFIQGMQVGGGDKEEKPSLYPWPTSGDEKPTSYGETPGVPLYLQEGDMPPVPAPPPSMQPQGGAAGGAPPGMPPGAPPGSPPGGPPPGMPPGAPPA